MVSDQTVGDVLYMEAFFSDLGYGAYVDVQLSNLEVNIASKSSCSRQSRGSRVDRVTGVFGIYLLCSNAIYVVLRA